MKAGLLGALLLVAAPLQAQSGAPLLIDSTPAFVRTGKWVGAGLFAGTMAMAFLQHHRANEAFHRLRGYCQTAACAIGPDGRYADAGAESRYQEIVSGDRAARVWLIAGQVTFIGTAALIVMELTRDKATTNIPFSGLLVEPGRLGWKLSF